MATSSIVPFGSVSDAAILCRKIGNDTPQWRILGKEKNRENQKFQCKRPSIISLGRTKCLVCSPPSPLNQKNRHWKRKYVHITIFHQNADWKNTVVFCARVMNCKGSIKVTAEVCAMHWLIHEIAKIQKLKRKFGSHPDQSRGFGRTDMEKSRM